LRYSRTSSAIKRWPIAHGTVLHSGIKGHSGDEGGTSYSPCITYRYEVSGQIYQSDNFNVYDLLGGYSAGSAKSARSTASRYPVGHQVPVRYDPARPARAVLDITTPTIMIWFLYGMAVFCLVMCGAGGVAMIVAALLS
jgi:hypothetical protein